jgi:hypothetical protein
MLTANLSLTSMAARQADADIAHVFLATVQPPGCMNTTNKKKSPGCEEPGFLIRDWRGSDVGRRGPGEGREGSRKEISPEDRSGLRNLLPPVSSAKCGTKRTGDYANGKPNDAHPTNHRLSLHWIEGFTVADKVHAREMLADFEQLFISYFSSAPSSS